MQYVGMSLSHGTQHFSEFWSTYCLRPVAVCVNNVQNTAFAIFNLSCKECLSLNTYANCRLSSTKFVSQVCVSKRGCTYFWSVVLFDKNGEKWKCEQCVTLGLEYTLSPRELLLTPSHCATDIKMAFLSLSAAPCLSSFLSVNL